MTSNSSTEKDNPSLIGTFLRNVNILWVTQVMWSMIWINTIMRWISYNLKFHFCCLKSFLFMNYILYCDLHNLITQLKSQVRLMQTVIPTFPLYILTYFLISPPPFFSNGVETRLAGSQDETPGIVLRRRRTLALTAQQPVCERRVCQWKHRGPSF